MGQTSRNKGQASKPSSPHSVLRAETRPGAQIQHIKRISVTTEKRDGSEGGGGGPRTRWALVCPPCHVRRAGLCPHTLHSLMRDRNPHQRGLLLRRRLWMPCRPALTQKTHKHAETRAHQEAQSNAHAHMQTSESKRKQGKEGEQTRAAHTRVRNAQRMPTRTQEGQTIPTSLHKSHIFTHKKRAGGGKGTHARACTPLPRCWTCARHPGALDPSPAVHRASHAVYYRTWTRAGPRTPPQRSCGLRHSIHRRLSRPAMGTAPPKAISH